MSWLKQLLGNDHRLEVGYLAALLCLLAAVGAGLWALLKPAVAEHARDLTLKFLTSGFAFFSQGKWKPDQPPAP